MTTDQQAPVEPAAAVEEPASSTKPGAADSAASTADWLDELRGLAEALRTPLESISGFAELLGAHRHSPQLIREMAGDIQQAAHRLDGLVRKLQRTTSAAGLGTAEDAKLTHVVGLLAREQTQRRNLEAQLAEARRAQHQLQTYAADFRRTYAESRNRLRMMTALNEVSRLIASTVDAGEVLARTSEGLRRLLPRDANAVYVLEEGETLAQRRAQWCPPGTTEPPATLELDASALTLASPERVAPRQRGQETPGDREASWRLILPIASASQLFGALLLERFRPAAFADEERYLAELIASQTAMALHNARLATTDPLTSLYNRRYFEQALAFECERARRVGRPLGLLIVDVDHFKSYNERFGHQAGDAVLRLTAGTLGSGLRRTDIVARIGGEEFAAILPENDAAALAVAGERLRQAVEQLPAVRFEGRQLPGVRISIGGSSLPGERVEANELIRLADSALRRAKRAGRNRVMVAGSHDR